MISLVSGKVVEVDKSGHLAVVATASGVGYSITCTTPQTLGEQVDLATCAVYREDAATLYGFASAAERNLFSELVKAPGLGPTTALNMITKLGVGGIKRVFRDKDDAAAKELHSVDGIGPKTAAKLLLTVNIDTEGAEESTASAAKEQARNALLGLGFSTKEVDAALAKLEAEGETPEEAQKLVSAALATIRGDQAKTVKAS